MKERNSGIDLLKILCMFMVVILHILGHGGILNTAIDLTLNDTVAWFIEILCYCAVNTFAMISGYLCIKSNFKYKNVINLWILVFFYNVLINLIFNGLDIKLFIKSLFPVSTNSHWYFSSYFGFILFIPFINKWLNSLSKFEYKKLIYTILFVTCGVCFYSSVYNVDAIKLFNGYISVWLLCLYIIGGYINLFDFKFKHHTKLCYFLLYMLSSFIMLLSRIIILKFSFLNELLYSSFFINYISIFVVFNSYVLLLLFLKVRVNTILKKILSFITNLSFSVYIIHEQNFIRSYFIENQFMGFASLDIFRMVFMILYTGIIIYVLCTIIDVFRYYLFKLFKVDIFSSWLDKKIMCLLTKKG